MRIIIREDTDIDAAFSTLIPKDPDQGLVLAAIKSSALDMKAQLQKLAEHGAHAEFSKKFEFGSKKVVLVGTLKKNTGILSKIKSLFGGG